MLDASTIVLASLQKGKQGGSRVEEIRYEPFVLRQRIGDMVKYGYPITMGFGRKYRELGDQLRKSMLEMYRYSVEIDKKYYKKTTVQNLDVELAVLRGLVRLAAEKENFGQKFSPPISVRQYETWAKMNEEIGRLVGGYIKSLKQ